MAVAPRRRPPHPTRRSSSSPAARPSPRPSPSPTSTSSPGYPIRPYDTVIQAIAKKIANGQLVAEYIVAEGEHSQFEIVKHASTVGRPRLLRLVRRGLGVRDGVPGGDAAAARADGLPRRQPRARRPGRLRRRAQRRAVRARPRLDAVLDRHLAGGDRHHADRLSRRRGPARLPAAGHLGRRRVPHALPGADAGAAQGEGRPVPAALRPRRSAPAPRQPDHGGPAGQRGLGHRDPSPERRGDEAGGHA